MFLLIYFNIKTAKKSIFDFYKTFIMPKRIDMEISESISFLKDQVVNNKTYKTKTLDRINMLILIKEKQYLHVSSLANYLGYERRTIAEWIKKYKKGKFTELVNYRVKSNMRKVLTNKTKKAIKNRQCDLAKKFVSYKELLIWVNNVYQPELKYSTLYNFARKIKISRNSNFRHIAGSDTTFGVHNKK